MMADNIIKANVGSDITINNYDLHLEINQLKPEEEAGHERNINNMTLVEDYKFPWKDIYATTVDTVNETAYTFLNSWNDEISDSTEQVETSKDPIKDTQTSKEQITDTHIVDRVCN